MRQLCKCGRKAEKYSRYCLPCEFAIEQEAAKGKSDSEYRQHKIRQAKAESAKVKQQADQYGIVRNRGK